MHKKIEENWNRRSLYMSLEDDCGSGRLLCPMETGQGDSTFPPRLQADCNPLFSKGCQSRAWHSRLRKCDTLTYMCFWPFCFLFTKPFKKKFSFYFEYQLTKATYDNYYIIMNDVPVERHKSDANRVEQK